MDATVLIAGAGGQLGRELQRSVPEGVQAVAMARSALDIGDADQVAAVLAEHRPSVVINAAAYTAVDQAESARDEAMRINAEGPGHLASACAREGARLLHVSTDFVFDGSAGSPYEPGDSTAPLGVYGASKLAGEEAALAALPKTFILRTAWVYSAFGGNFVKTMLRLMGERDELGVVADQVGSPTWAAGLARALWAAAARPALEGIYHWSDAGACSWYDFAVAIQEEGEALGLVPGGVTVRPLTTQDYPTPAARPAYSVLAKEQSWRDLELEGVHWRSQLRQMLRDLKENADG